MVAFLDKSTVKNNNSVCRQTLKDLTAKPKNVRG